MHPRISKHLPAGLIGVALTIAACAQSPGINADRDVVLHLANSGGEPLRCSIVFGHWVYRELGVLAPGDVRDIAMNQAAKDGALYINRYDGKRQMMIENLFCGRPENWRETVGQVDLASIRSARVTRIAAHCAASPAPGRVACEVTEIGQ